ncbi:MAG: hypothetical protein LBK26_02325 [Rickettsiales bacterium]|jgi:hypothetical protein|nr:hypothetical protein [Rickettsiales bacterium]
MKKLFLISCGIALFSACGLTKTELHQQITNDASQEGQELDAELSQKADVLKILETYDKFYYDGEPRARISMDTNNLNDVLRERTIISYMTEPDINIDCLYSHSYNYFSKYNSDECILYRRENTRKSKAGHFNYAKYLPDTAIKSDEDFLKLFEKYREYVYRDSGNEFSCNVSNSVTTVEREQCEQESKDKLTAYAFKGITAEKHKNTDCENAQSAAKAKYNAILEELGTDELLVLDYLVSDFAADGVFVNSCNFGYCPVFAYTSDKYANQDLFNPKQILYKRDGVYEYQTTAGGVNSVKAYRPTKYTLKDIDYKTYLKNKSHKCN